MTKSKMFVIDPHPAIPPSDLLKSWEDKWFNEEEHADVLLIQAFQAGADEELEACCEWVKGRDWTWTPADLRAARRPKPPSLKQQALDLLKTDLEPGQEVASITLPAKSIDTIRRALESIPDSE